MFLMLLASFVAFAETKPMLYTICKNGSQVRTIRVDIDDKNICHTVYTKMGVEQTIGTGKNKDSCKDFLIGVRNNLEKSNWKCRDVESATVESSL